MLGVLNSYPAPRRKRNRKRKIIWFNPPFNKALQTNIGRTFLHLLEKHSPPHHRLHKIFNRNTVKVSYGCTQNMSSIISNQNNKDLIDKLDNVDTTFNCRKKDLCPLENSCLTPSIVYNANVTRKDTQPQGKNYLGLTEGPFKQRYDNISTRLCIKNNPIAQNYLSISGN